MKIVLSGDGFGVEGGGEGETSSWFCFGLLCCCVAGGGCGAGTGGGRSSGLSGPGDTGPVGTLGTERGRVLTGEGAVLIELGIMLIEGSMLTELGMLLTELGMLLIELGMVFTGSGTIGRLLTVLEMELTEIGRVLTEVAASCCGRRAGCWRWGRGCSWVETRLGARGGVPSMGTAGAAGTAGTADTEAWGDNAKGDGGEALSGDIGVN